MATITDNDLKMFQERSKTELTGRGTGSIAWDSVIWDLCHEVRRLRSAVKERGDCARLREALIRARYEICRFARYKCQSLSWENSNIQANCGDVLCSWRGLCDAKTAINAALAATKQKGESNGNK